MDDGFVAAVDQVVEAGRQVSAAVETAVNAMLEAGDARRAGRSVADIVDDRIAAGGREMRLSVAESFRDYERSIASMRALVVRVLVDEEGLSLTAAGQRLRISRQAAARLYQNGASA